MTEIQEPTLTTQVAVITTNISYIQTDIRDIKQYIALLANVYATSKELQDVAKTTEERLNRLEKNNHLWKWLSPTLSAIIAVIVEYLFIFYIQHFK